MDEHRPSITISTLALIISKSSFETCLLCFGSVGLTWLRHTHSWGASAPLQGAFNRDSSRDINKMTSSDDENLVVIPVADSLSDGDEATWRLDDPQFKYRMLDDTRWRLHLAQMWVERTGASEQGKPY